MFTFGMKMQTTNGWDGDFWQLYANDTYSTADGTAGLIQAQAYLMKQV